MKLNDIVKYNEKLGLLIKGEYGRKDKLLFMPAGTGSHYEEDLDIVTESQITETTLSEKISYLIADFTWGEVIHSEVINRGEYVIISYKDKENNTLYHTYLNFKDINRSYISLDSALIGLIDYKYQGANSQAVIHIERILEMNK